MQFSVVNYNNLYESITFRFDAEFYHPEAIKYEKRILSQFHGTTLKGAGCHVVSGPFGSSLKSEAYLNKGIPFVRISDLRDFIISKDNLIYISEEDNERLSSSKLNVGDIVLSKVGNTIGVASKVTSAIGECNISENNLGIRMPSNMREQEKDLILAYLNSKPGQIQILRAISGNAQPKLNVSDIELIKIPQPSDRLSDLISSLIRKSESSLNDAQDIYQQAHITLLFELGLSNWQPNHQLSFIKNYSAADKAGRIDAEYFQPKYDEIVKAIKSYPGGWDTLGNIVSVRKSIEVGSDAYMDEGDVPFVRVSNLSPFEITEEKYISNELYSELSQHQPKQGEILFSKDGTPGIAYHLNEKPKKMIPSGGILRLQLKNKKTNEDYLTLVLNSMIVQEQINRDVGGSIILHWRPEQVKETLIPILPEDKQSQIRQKVTESFNLRKQSKHLLECAKRAVEIAIEHNEAAAIKWLEEQTKEAE